MKIETFFFFIVVEHFIAAAHVEIGFWFERAAFDYHLTFLLPLAHFLMRNQESVQFTVLFSLWFSTLLLFGALLPRLQRKCEEAEEQERLQEELRDLIKNSKF